jgi:hypothetical protein
VISQLPSVSITIYVIMIKKTKIFVSAIIISNTCQLSLIDIEMHPIHRVRTSMTAPWIDFVMTLQKQSCFLDLLQHDV